MSYFRDARHSEIPSHSSGGYVSMPSDSSSASLSLLSSSSDGEQAVQVVDGWEAVSNAGSSFGNANNTIDAVADTENLRKMPTKSTGKVGRPRKYVRPNTDDGPGLLAFRRVLNNEAQRRSRQRQKDLLTYLQTLDSCQQKEIDELNKALTKAQEQNKALTYLVNMLKSQAAANNAATYQPNNSHYPPY